MYELTIIEKKRAIKQYTQDCHENPYQKNITFNTKQIAILEEELAKYKQKIANL